MAIAPGRPQQQRHGVRDVADELALERDAGRLGNDIGAVRRQARLRLLGGEALRRGFQRGEDFSDAQAIQR